MSKEIGMRLVCWVACAAPALAFAAADCPRTSLPAVSFDTQNLSEHVRVLASDDFAGRAPASAGETKTLKYLAGQFAKLGLTPAGDQGTWLQSVPLRKIAVLPPVTIRVSSGKKTIAQQYGEEVMITSFTATSSLQLREAPMVFVGYGVTAPELGWDDFKGVDLHGKVAIFLINDPDFDSPVPGQFGGKAMTRYGRWSYKVEEAGRRGATAALVIHEDGPASYGWATVQNSWGVPQFDIIRTQIGKPRPLVQGWLRRDVASRWLHEAGLDLAELKKRAMRPDFVPVPLNGLRLQIRARVRVTPVSTHNLIARLPGRERPDESVFYGAHWDHLGVAKPGASGDRIYHGAVDNATGVAGMLELARVFASAPRTARSIYFIAFTAEEEGLLGSEYFALHPPASLENTAALLNMDMFSTDGPACDLSIRGPANSSLHDMIAAAASAQGRLVRSDPHLEAGYFYRADHFSLAKRGVPAITTMSGQDLYDGGSTAGEKDYEEFIAHRYHQPADQWSPDWDLRGEAIDLQVLYQVGRNIADSDAWPQWREGSEFKQVRDSSENLRLRSSASRND